LIACHFASLESNTDENEPKRVDAKEEKSLQKGTGNWRGLYQLG
jgi:hypothetical protein